MGNHYHPRHFGKNTSGATAIEFAIVASVFFMMMFAIIEYGLIMFSKVIIESVTQQASRSVGIGNHVAGCADRVCSIKKLVQEKSFGLIREESVRVTAKVVTDTTTATAPPIPDICLNDPKDPYAAVCTQWQENNGTPGYQPAGLDATSIGIAGDLVEVRVTYLWRILFPFFSQFFGQNGVLTISSTTVVKNEPFGDAQ